MSGAAARRTSGRADLAFLGEYAARRVRPPNLGSLPTAVRRRTRSSWGRVDAACRSFGAGCPEPAPRGACRAARVPRSAVDGIGSLSPSGRDPGRTRPAAASAHTDPIPWEA
ncbi:hypothetical protein ACE1SV_69000 [Streptomyces sp. E-15]